MGRPPKYPDAKELSDKIEEYFATTGPQVMKDKDGNPQFTQYGKPVILKTIHPTIIDLAHHLDVNRDTWIEWRKRPDISGIIKRADERIQAYMVQRLMDPDVKPPGIQFILKNVHGWKDETEVKHKGDPENPINTLAKVEIVLVEPKKPEPVPDTLET